MYWFQIHFLIGQQNIPMVILIEIRQVAEQGEIVPMHSYLKGKRYEYCESNY